MSLNQNKVSISKYKKDVRIIVFIDMANSSCSWADKPDKMAQETFPAYLSTILQCANEYEHIQSESNFTGDGMMIAFDINNIFNALLFGWEVIKEWKEKRKELHIKNGIRVGIHLGNVNIFINNNEPHIKFLCSDTINRAQRIESFPKLPTNKNWPKEDCCIISKLFIDQLEMRHAIGIERKNRFLKGPERFEFAGAKKEKEKEEGIRDDVDVFYLYNDPKTILGSQYFKTENKKIKNNEKEDVLLNAISFFNQGNFLTRIAKEKKHENSYSFYKEAIQRYKSATELINNFHDAYYNCGIACYDVAFLDDKNKKKYLEESIENYKKALKINPENNITLNNLGNTFHALSKIEEESIKKELAEKAIDYVKDSVNINSKFYPPFYNWGNTLKTLADNTKNKEKKVELLNNSIEKYKICLSLKPEYSSAILNWANALFSLAELENSKTFYEKALEKLESVLKIDPKNYNALIIKGISFLKMYKTENQNLEYYEKQIIESYETALKFCPDKYKVLFSYGNSLFELANHQTASNIVRLQKMALEKYKTARKIKNTPELEEKFNNIKFILSAFI